MGRRNRERIERIKCGQEKSIASQIFSNPVAKRAVSFASRARVVDELRNANLSDQIDVLNSQVALSRPSKLRRAITSKAPKEMDKGIRRLRGEGKDVTVDALCSEIKSTPGFLAMCRKVGLELEWFEKLAKERMEVYGL